MLVVNIEERKHVWLDCAWAKGGSEQSCGKENGKRALERSLVVGLGDRVGGGTHTCDGNLGGGVGVWGTEG